MTPSTPSSVPSELGTRVPPAGRVDLSTRGRITLTGPDAMSFLHALVSNDVAALTRGTGCYALYLTPQGRIVADMRVYHRGDHLLLDVAAGSAPALAARLDQLIFSEDVRIDDASAALTQIRVIGEASARVLSRAFDVDEAALASLGRYDQLDVRGGFVARTDDALAPSFDVFVTADRGAEINGGLDAAGAAVLSDDVVTALRIEAGRPLFGVDMTEETIPLEAGLLDRAISLTKGCYVGQEVIIRVLHRGGGRVAKRLVTLRFDEAVDTVPMSSDVLIADGRDVGRITSAALSPATGRVIALGYVHRDVAEAGKFVSANGAVAEITGFAS